MNKKCKMLSMHFQVRVPKYILKVIFAVIQTQTIPTAKKCFGFLRYFRFECQKIATTILSQILPNIGMFLLITQHCLCIELIMNTLLLISLFFICLFVLIIRSNNMHLDYHKKFQTFRFQRGTLSVAPAPTCTPLA